MTTFPINPPLECDVVMKGGITSGVIYPRAVCELARTYRIRSVGGASAGAIAAAAAAAAEVGRATGGFEELERLPDDITAPSPAGGSTLFRLFQPSRATASLYRAFTAGLGLHGTARSLAMVRGVVQGFWPWILAGAVPGVIVFVLGLMGGGPARPAAVIAGLLLLLLGALAGAAAGALRVVARIPSEGFGMCSGMPGAGSRGAVPLTPWLHERIQAIAGRSPGSGPLTFGDLWAAGIELQTMTTNLTRRQPMAMPWRSQEYFFDPALMRGLFPEDVVAWMETHPPALPAAAEASWQSALLRQKALPLRPLPAADDLPVIVATRMSLSFPVLISAVPLHAVNWQSRENRDAVVAWREWRAAHPDGTAEQAAQAVPAPRFEPNWFSDGGICSNLPVHFFDRPLPTRPTFAIDLAKFPEGHEKDPDEYRNSMLPSTNTGGLLRPWTGISPRGIGALGSFLMQVVETARGWVDAGQLTMPGYRDRVVTIWHDEAEGGMNLTMPPEVVTRLAARGAGAAQRLTRRFAGEAPGAVPAAGWDNHRWIRFRSSLAGLTGWLGALRDGYSAPALGATPYEQFAGPGASAPLPSYAVSGARRDALNARTESVLEVARELRSDDVTVAGAPRPRPELRLVPDAGIAAALTTDGNTPSSSTEPTG